MSNQINRQRLTVSEWLLLYIVTTYAPTTRLVSQMTIIKAKEMAWLVPIASCIVYIPLLAVVAVIVKKFQGMSYIDILTSVFGKWAGKAVGTLLLLYLVVLLSMYIRYSTDQLTTTIYIATDYRIFVFIELFAIFFMLRGGIATIARMNKIIFFLLVSQFVLLLIFMAKDMDLQNVTPVHTGGIPGVFDGLSYALCILGYVSFLLIVNDKVILHENFQKEFIRLGIFMITAFTLVIFWTLAIFGHRVTERLNYPFFQAVKGIIIFKGMTGMEALFLSLWLLSEFMIICLYSFCILHLARGIFNIKSELPFLSVFLVFIFLFSQYFCSNTFELQKFSRNISTPGNMVFAVALPFVVYAAGKIRKKI
jgi:spore germination protein KB